MGEKASWNISWSFLDLVLDLCRFFPVWVRWWQSSFQGEIFNAELFPALPEDTAEACFFNYQLNNHVENPDKTKTGVWPLFHLEYLCLLTIKWESFRPWTPICKGHIKKKYLKLIKWDSKPLWLWGQEIPSGITWACLFRGRKLGPRISSR